MLEEPKHTVGSYVGESALDSDSMKSLDEDR